MRLPLYDDARFVSGDPRRNGHGVVRRPIVYHTDLPFPGLGAQECGDRLEG
jgi:hypothetical protein